MLDVSDCGRVLVFMARVLPLAERSGLNITGLFSDGGGVTIDDSGLPDDVRDFVF